MNEYEVRVKGFYTRGKYKAHSPLDAAHMFIDDRWTPEDGERVWVGEPGTYEVEGSGEIFLISMREEYDLEPVQKGAEHG